MPPRRRFKPHCIPCEAEGCYRHFSSRAGLKNHLRTHDRRLVVRRPQEQQRQTLDQHDHDRPPGANSDSDDDTGIPGEPFGNSNHRNDSPGRSEPDRTPGESIRLHPKLNGSFHSCISETI